MFPPCSTAGEWHGQEGVWTELKGLQQHGSAGERRGWNIGSKLSCTSLGTKALLLLSRSCQTGASMPSGDTDQP